MTSIVGAGNREGKFQRRLQSEPGCDELKKTNGEVPTIQTKRLWQRSTNSRVAYFSEMCSTLDKISRLLEGVRQNKHIPVMAIYCSLIQCTGLILVKMTISE